MTLSTIVGWLARGLALAGGVVLVIVTILTVVSITGRSLIWAGLSPVPGDVELVEAGMGFAIFAFLPWCQYVRGHATVDIFTNFLPSAANRVIDVVSELLMTLVIVLFAWRLWFGMLDKIRYKETTFILQFPIWWPYAAAMVAAAIGVIVSFYVLYQRIREAAAGATIPSQGSVH
ncbi:MAG: TRAP transporter small permease [Rhizobiaceae bacterium]|nr:TRAP transporter small permease [Rhizobiaceae bacterium]